MSDERSRARRFEAEVPVLVAGGGAAGLTAALALASSGVECFVLEAAHDCLGSSSMSLGALCAAGTAEQARHGIVDDGSVFLEDIMRRTDGLADPVVARVVAGQSGETLDWLAEEHRIPFQLDLEWRPVYGHSVQRLHTVPEKSGMAMMARLRSAAEAAQVGILTGAEVTSLMADASDRVAGVRIRRPDGSSEEIGCGALILATSGFGGNRDMIRRHIPEMADAIYFGWEANRGDGILWGRELGGRVGDMASYQGLGLLAADYGLDVNPKLLIQGGIQVNLHGIRFSDELEDVSGQGATVIAQPGAASWVVFDSRIRDTCAHLPQFRELENLGGVRRAATIEALAGQTGLPEPSLRSTLEAWNSCLRGERQDPFGRPAGEALPLAPDYFAIRVTGALFHTQGGLCIQEEGRVVRTDGAPLPNLYAAGGTARGITGPTASGYLPGAGLCCAFTLGRLAGLSAARAVNR